MPLSDEELMLEYQNGDTHAFGILVKRYKAKITRYASYLLGDEEEAEDMAQEVFLRVLRAAETYRPKAKFTTWLYKIASNLCYDELRRRKQRSYVSLDTTLEYSDDEENQETAQLYETLPDPHAVRPDQEVQRREMGALMGKALGTLSQDHRQVVEMRILQSLPYSQIAEEAGRSEGTVKSRMHYAMKKLKEELLEILEWDDIVGWFEEMD